MAKLEARGAPRSDKVIFDDWMEKLFRFHKHITHNAPSVAELAMTHWRPMATHRSVLFFLSCHRFAIPDEMNKHSARNWHIVITAKRLSALTLHITEEGTKKRRNGNHHSYSEGKKKAKQLKGAVASATVHSTSPFFISSFCIEVSHSSSCSTIKITLLTVAWNDENVSLGCMHSDTWDRRGRKKGIDANYH